MSFDPISYAMGAAAGSGGGGGGGGGIDPSDATATAGDILSGKTAYIANGTKATGTIQNQEAQTITPTTSDQTISAGKYLSGAQTIKGDSNLVAGNIKKNVTLFGVTGSYEGGGAAKPDYLISDGDTVSTFYFNTGYSLDSFLAGLTYDQTEPITGAGLSFRYLGFGNLSAFDLTNLGMSGEYALAWADANSGSVTPLYATAPVAAFSISAAGWQVPHFAPGASILVDLSDVYPAFLSIMDSVAAKAAIAFNADAKSVTPDFGSGDMHIAASSGEVWNAVDVAAPAALIPGNVKNGVTIAGVTGSYSGGGGSNEVKNGGFFAVYSGYVETRSTFDHVPSVVIAVGTNKFSGHPCYLYTCIIYSAEVKKIQSISTASTSVYSSISNLENPSIEITGEGKLRITSSTINAQYNQADLSLYYID